MSPFLDLFSERRNMMEIFQTPDAKALGLPFNSAVRAGETLYLSGVLGNLPGTMTLAPGGMAGQARQTMENIGTVLRYCGLDFADIVKCTVMLADMSEWAEFNKIYVTYFAPDRLPARTALGANGSGRERPGARGESGGRMHRAVSRGNRAADSALDLLDRLG